MKARVKATGEIVDINPTLIDMYDFVDNKGIYYTIEQLELIRESVKPIKKINDPDYWTRLEHQYAGMAMQGISGKYLQEYRNYCLGRGDEAKATMKDFANAMADVCNCFAHALIQKLKEKEERK